MRTVCALIATRCPHGWGVLKWTCLNRSPLMATRYHYQGGSLSNVPRPEGGWEDYTMRFNASWIMVEWDPPVNRLARLKTLLSRNFLGRCKKNLENENLMQRLQWFCGFFFQKQKHNCNRAILLSFLLKEIRLISRIYCINFTMSIILIFIFLLRRLWCSIKPKALHLMASLFFKI